MLVLVTVPCNVGKINSIKFNSIKKNIWIQEFYAFTMFFQAACVEGRFAGRYLCTAVVTCLSTLAT